MKVSLTNSSTEVDLWFLDIDQVSPDLAGFLYSLLCDEEKAESNRFRFHERRRRYRVSRGILRFILGMQLGVNPKGISFYYNSWGKPYLSNRYIDIKPRYFNVSDSGSSLAIGITSCSEIGVDIERLSKIVDLDLLAPKVLTPRELVCFHKIDEHLQKLFFLECWTAKEAVLKAMGKGLLIPMQSIELEHLSNLVNSGNSIGVTCDAEHLSVHIQKICSDLICSVALRQKETPYFRCQDASILFR